MPANKLLSYPHDVFLMVRLEFVQICGDELEAKILRVIERYVDEERTRLFQEAVNKAEGTPEQVMSITKDVWVSISYRLFMSDLFGTIASENTIKKAINSLLEKKIIFRRFDKKNRYDAPEYRIHISVVQMLLNVVGKSGYQKLIPSVIDTLKKLPPHEMTPSECQSLMLSSQSRVSEIDTNYNKGNDNNTGNNREREVADATARSHSSSQNDLSEETVKREAVKPSQKEAVHGHAHQHPIVDNNLSTHNHLPDSPKANTNEVKQPPAPSKAHVNKSPFPVPKRAKPQSNIMDTLPSEEAVRIMNDWDSIFSRPCTRTENHIKAAELLVPCHPTKDDLSDIRKFCYSSNPKWYRDKGVSLQDVAKNFDKWQSHREAPKPSEGEDSNEYRVVSSFGQPGFSLKDEFYPSEAEKKAHYAAHPQGVKS